MISHPCKSPDHSLRHLAVGVISLRDLAFERLSVGT